MAIDDRSGGRGYPLPHPDNLLNNPDDETASDVHRLRTALTAVDGDVSDMMRKAAQIEDALLLNLDVV